MFDWVLGRFRPIEMRGLAVGVIAGLVLLAVRLFIAMPFWLSGLTKWVSFPSQLSSSAVYLFSNEFKLHLPGGPYDMPFPVAAAFLSGLGEIILPVLLVAGLMTRFSALGILGMTVIIQLTIPDGWPIHIQWALAALVLLVAGPGLFSADRVLRFWPFGSRPAGQAA